MGGIYMLAFSFDVGNGFVKARNDKRSMIAPSSIAKKESMGSSSITGMSSSFDASFGYREFESSLDDGTTYIWGEEIADVVDPSSLLPTYTHNHRYTQKRFKLLCSFILAELASDYEEDELRDVIVVTGLPSQEVGTTEAEDFKRFLQQKHIVKINGKQLFIHVTDVRIIEQPLGTLLHQYMNESGQVHKELLNNTLTVIDFGAGTTIMDTFKNVKRLEDKSETYYEGMNDIHKRVAKRIEREHGIKSLDASFVEEGFRNNTMVATVSERKKYSFEDIAKDIITNFIDKLISDMDAVLTNRDSIDKFILTGGGVHIVSTYFQDTFGEDSVLIVENSQEANLSGFYQLASTISRKEKAS